VRRRLTIIRDEAQDEPVVRGYEDGIAAEGRCRVELLPSITSRPRAHSVRTKPRQRHGQMKARSLPRTSKDGDRAGGTGGPHRLGYPATH
jgi:hypothetical protein